MAQPKSYYPYLASSHKVWDKAPHNAFTDLYFYHGYFYLAFREADRHQWGNNGVVRILRSVDGLTYEPFLLIEEEGIDLRDPHFSTLPDGRLHLVMGGLKLDQEGKIIHTGTRVQLFDQNVSPLELFSVLEPNEWLWRLKWHKGVGYGVAYIYNREGYTISLYKTFDGLRFEKMQDLEIDEWPSETAIDFDEEGTMYLLVRRGIDWNTHAVLGEAEEPYTTFSWYDTGFSLGGPQFLVFPDGKLWIVARLLYGTPYGVFAQTALLLKDGEDLFRKLYFPSFGDTGYPGLVYKDGELSVSYYSEHEGKCAIYVSKVLLSQ